MKRLKKVILMSYVILLSICFLGCEKTVDPVKLETPTLVLDGNIARWNEIENAFAYEILQNDKTYTLGFNSQSRLLNNNDTLKVRAIGDGKNYVNSDWSNEVTYIKQDLLGDQIKEEYESLKNGTSSVHTTWTFTGEIVVLDVNYNTSYNNYNVKAILNVDGINIGVYNGFVGGTYPVDVTGLEASTTMTVTGTIAENYTLTLDGITAEIEFSKPEISWNGKEDNKEEQGEGVNFFMINDTHGALLDSDSSVSIGRVDTLLTELTEKNGEYIKIHNGDAFQGSYVCGQKYGLPLIEAFNIMDFDCFVLGNHEFDWGLEKIEAYADGNLANGEANFPFLGANIYYAGTKTRPDWIKPYTIVEYGDVEVGIIGVIGATQESSILTSNVKDYTFVDPVSIIEDYASYLRTDGGCEVVVVATHDYDDWLNSSLASFSGNSLIDGIFCAHTHQYVSDSIRRSDGVSIPVVQNTDKNKLATGVTIYLENNKMSSFRANSYSPINYDISSDIQELINSYSELIEDSNKVIGYTNSRINKSTLGSYSTKAMLDYTYNNKDFDNKIDIAIMNTGGVRATINSGDITKALVFEVFPFNNAVVLVNMSGKLIKSLCNANEGYLYINVSDDIGSYNNLKDNTIYQMAVIDYVFEGPYYPEFASLTTDDYIYSNIIMRDILIEYLDELY